MGILSQASAYGIFIINPLYLFRKNSMSLLSDFFAKERNLSAKAQKRICMYKPVYYYFTLYRSMNDLIYRVILI